MSTYQLTSEVIFTPSADGVYPFNQRVYLYTQEALRREFQKLDKALEKFNPSEFPWKAYCFNDWLRQFFIPMIVEVYEMEEKIMYIHYLALNAEVPMKLSEDHIKVKEMLVQLRDNSHEIWNIVVLGGDNEERLTNRINNLKKTYHEIKQLIVGHMNEQEQFWPAIIAQYGEDQYLKLEKKMFTRETTLVSFENMMMSIFNAMGIVLDKNYPLQPDEAPWCNAATGKQVMDYFPIMTKNVQMPKWNKRYQRYKTMIVSCTGQTDVMQLQEVEHAGCNCTIA